MKHHSIKDIIKGLLFAIVFILSSCGKPKDLIFGEVRDVSVKNLSLNGVDLQATVPIENPNGYQMKINNADMNLSTNGNALANIKQNLPVTIGAKSKADYIINVSVNLLNKGNILSVVNLLNSNSNVDLDGTVNVQSLVFNKNVNVHQKAIQNLLKPAFEKMKLF